MKKIKKVIVHNGIFHADDVAVVALMRILGVKEYERVSVAPEESEGIIIADIGMGKYDHHQLNAKKYPDGGKYSAIGLIWEDFGKYLFKDERIRNYFRDRFIRPIERADNGEGTCSFAHIIEDSVPTWDDESITLEEAFEEAVQFMVRILEKEFKHLESISTANHIIEQELKKFKDKNYLILDKHIPWKMSLIHSDKEFVIFPSERGGFILQCVPVKLNQYMPVKRIIPESWLIDKPKGCTFVHNTRFMAVFNTVQDTVLAINNIYADTDL